MEKPHSFSILFTLPLKYKYKNMNKNMNKIQEYECLYCNVLSSQFLNFQMNKTEQQKGKFS